MRKLIFITTICALLAIPALAEPTARVYQTTYSNGSGGEFALSFINWDWNPLPYYDASTSNIVHSPSFQTFCVEHSENFNPGTEYSVTFSNNAIAGGGGPSGDPISLGTAWLYHMFQSQDPDLGYDWGAGRVTSAGELQNAIWYLEGEGGSLTPAYSAMLTDKFGSVTDAMADNHVGLNPVMVVNLWDKGFAGNLDHLIQDQLVCVPVPAAALLGMLGLGVAGLKLRKYA